MRHISFWSLCAAVLSLVGCNGSPAFVSGTRSPNNASAGALSSGYKVLYSFQGAGTSDGAAPMRHMLVVFGTLYGMTSVGGSGCHPGVGCGTLFAITTDGAENVVYGFKGYPDGFYPDAGLINVNGTLYGTTSKGGAYNKGSVFKVTRSGVEHILHSFYKNAFDGAYPEAGLTDVNGTLYGTTHGGGPHGKGTIFKIATSGKENVIYSFGTDGTYDGAWPAASLTQLKGTLYGTTTGGGKYSGCPHLLGCGTIFAVTPSGKERVIHNFRGAEGDGDQPVAGLTVMNGDLYGTTVFGGVAPCYAGCGVVFKVTKSGAETVLHRFRGSDGAYPGAGLAPLHGALYGTTNNGGGYSRCSNSCGTVFKIDAAGHETVMYRFRGNPDGQNPEGALTEVGGVLYGTTAYGGLYCEGSHSMGCGTVFQINP